VQRTFLILVGFGIALTHGRGLYVADAGAQPALFQTTRVSVSSTGDQGNVSGYPSISADGRYVAFESYASNFVPGDTNGCRDVFVHDRQTAATTRVSVSSAGEQGNNASYYPSISADGRYVAFESAASNLVPGDTNGCDDVFVHDRQTAATTRVSVSSAGDQGNYGSRYPSVSSDGRYVAFDSLATNLVPGDTNGKYDVFIHDRQTGATTRVSVSSAGDQGNSHSSDPLISADGRYVAFDGLATNLVPGDTNGYGDVFVHDRQTGATTRVSVSSAGAQGNGSSSYPSISADGRYVAFESSATNLVPGDTNNKWDVFVHDRQTAATTRVSVSSAGAQGDGSSGGSYSYTSNSISADGRYVALYSYATNLVPGDTNGNYDVFVHDRQTAVTTRVSVSSAGEQGYGSSYHPSISADGRYVAFDSSASNLVPGDTNGSRDVFVHDRACLSIATSPVDQTVCAGQPVAFSVIAGGDAPTYRWRRDGIDIPDATESTYAIPSAAPEHAGSYDVVVTNGCGSLTSNPATLTVNTPPSITGHPSSATICQGQSYQFCVTATGTPPPGYQWRRNGGNIGGATSSCYGATLAGSYDCVVSNVCGTATSNAATLTVWPTGGGDVNGDGLVDGQDVQGFVDQLLAGGPPSRAFCAADMSGDGVVSDADVPLFVAALLLP
jgi:Tol biopolymer transport system component